MAKNVDMLTYKIADMSCSACEKRIEASLSGLPGIISIQASYSRGKVVIEYDSGRMNPDAIKEKLKSLHYTVLEMSAQSTSKIKQWAGSILILAGIIAGYILLDNTGVFNLFPMADQDTALPVLFVIGLLTSIHCVAMCGGINVSQCAGSCATGSAGKYQSLLPSVLYNSGRVISYTIIGGIVGSIGFAVTPSGSFKGIVAVAASIFMLIMGLNMLGLFPFLRRLIPHMPKIVDNTVNMRKTGQGPFVVGLLNGLMPCGPLQAMQLYALSTGSFLNGALAMFLFSLGTVPLMFGIGAISSMLNARFTGTMMKVSAILVMLLGLVMLNTGLSLSGFNALF